LLSIGLVGSWFCSCVISIPRKSLKLDDSDCSDEFPPDAVDDVELVPDVPADAVPVDDVVAVPEVLAAAACAAAMAFCCWVETDATVIFPVLRGQAVMSRPARIHRDGA